jgi:mRNA interferase YafQ
MRGIERTNQFKKDFRRELKGKHKASLEPDLLELINLLVKDKSLPKHYFDHALVGDWKDCRDCHIKPDLILIYSKPNRKTLKLIRLGSHSELSL